MIQEKDLEEAARELKSFFSDLCEQICGDDSDCIKECHKKGVSEVTRFISKIDLQTTSPEQLQRMVAEFKRSRTPVGVGVH